METKYWILAGWLLCDLLVFLWAWCDDLYYSHNVRKKFRKMKEVLTEE